MATIIRKTVKSGETYSVRIKIDIGKAKIEFNDGEVRMTAQGLSAVGMEQFAQSAATIYGPKLGEVVSEMLSIAQDEQERRLNAEAEDDAKCLREHGCTVKNFIG